MCPSADHTALYGGVEEFPLQEHKHLKREASGILEICLWHVHTAILLSRVLSPVPPALMWLVALPVSLRSKYILQFLSLAYAKQLSSLRPLSSDWALLFFSNTRLCASFGTNICKSLFPFLIRSPPVLFEWIFGGTGSRLLGGLFSQSDNLMWLYMYVKAIYIVQSPMEMRLTLWVASLNPHFLKVERGQQSHSDYIPVAA